MSRCTNSYVWATSMLGPVDDVTGKEGNGMKGVIFEDNLSSHKTDAVEKIWESKLPFCQTLHLPHKVDFGCAGN